MIFGIFGRKKKASKNKAIIEAAITILNVQLSLGVGDLFEKHQLISKVSDNFSRGYIQGVVDALLQAGNIDDEIERFAMAAPIYTGIFGFEHGAEYFRESIDHQNEPEFLRGMKLGGSEVFKFLKDKSSPMGLATYLLDKKS